MFARCFDDPSSQVQMAIEIVDETLAELLELRWEHLCDPDDRYLALDSRFRLVRRLASHRQEEASRLTGHHGSWRSSPALTIWRAFRSKRGPEAHRFTALPLLKRHSCPSRRWVWPICLTA